LHFENKKPRVKENDAKILSVHLTGDKLMQIKDNMESLIEQIKPHAYKLTHSFIVDDFVLHSKLSLRHGKIYEELYNTAMNSKLNKNDLEGVHDYIKPLSCKLVARSKL